MRNCSYGQTRNFCALEKYAIKLRLRNAINYIDYFTKSYKKNISIIELGCGYSGNNLLAIKKKNPDSSCTGIDLFINPELKSNEKMNFIEADINKWKPEKTYDCVLSLAVIEHLTDLQGHFNLISDCLSPNGIAIISTPLPHAHIIIWLLSLIKIGNEEYNDHKLYLTKAGIESLAKISNLKILKHETVSIGFNRIYLMIKN
mgnify:CR=1 FL=1